MSVVFINRFCHPDHSATSQILSDLTTGLAATGLAVAMVASRQRYDDPMAHLPAREIWQDVEIRRIWTSGFGRTRLLGRAIDYLTFYLSLPWTLCRMLKRGDVVVAKTDPPLVSLVVASVALLRGAKLVNWLQDVFPEVAVSLGEPAMPRPLAWMLRMLRNLSLRRAWMNVVIGERMAEYLSAQGVAADKLRVIPNWAHEDAIHPLPAECSELRQTLGWQARFVVGYSGNLGRAHDTDTLLYAMQKLAVHPGIAFLIVGGGHGYARLLRRATDAGLRNVRFLPYQPMDRLSDAMAASDLHLVSLRPELEGQIVPSKFYGIAAAERPIGFIGDPDGELARLVSAADCGFCVAPGQGERLAEAILRLSGDRETGLAQGRRARGLLDERFSRDAAHRQWHDLLTSMSRPKDATP